MSGSFNLEGAQKAGYSDSEVASFLASQRGFDINAARKAGYTDGEITGFLASPPKQETAFNSVADPGNAAYSQDAEAGTATSMPAANPAGGSISRGLGLGVRNVAEGMAGSLPGMAVDALTWPGRALMRAGGMHVDAPSDMVSKGLTAAGVPEPETSGEKLRGAMISGAASALPTMGLGSIAAAENAAPEVAKAFTQGVAGQMIGGAASGAASEGTRQLGGGELAQAGAGLVGGLVGGAAGTAATQRASAAIARIGAAKDADTAIAAAAAAVDAPVDRPMAQWMQPIVRDNPALNGDILPPEPAAPQSMADYLRANATAAPGTDLTPVPKTSPPAEAAASSDTINTAEAAKKVAQDHFRVMEAHGGEQLPAEATNSTIDYARNLADETPMVTAYRGAPHPLAQVVERLEDFRDQPMSLQDQTGIDRLMSDQINAQYDNKGHLSSEGNAILNLQTHLRGLVQDQIDNPQGAGLPGFEAKLAGNKAWSAYMKLDDLERMKQRADGTLNPEQAMKTQMNNYLNSARSRGLTDAERASYQTALHRGTYDGLLKVAASRLNAISGTAMLTHGLLTLNPATALAGAAEIAGSALARRAIVGRQDRLVGNVADVIGSGVPPAP